MKTPFSHLLFGHDTVECAYYLCSRPGSCLNFEHLGLLREAARLGKKSRPKAITLGSEEFLLQPRGTASGYPFLLENPFFSIQCGEFNKPNFFVTFRSFGLWQVGIQALHQRFLAWADSVGYEAFLPERLSRVDFTFDYQIEAIDFDENNFVSSANKDNQHRKNRTIQTLRFGEGDVVLRVYNKIDEIEENSGKTWFFDLWGCDSKVWRIEWQVRKQWLKTFGIRTVADLKERQGDLLRILTHEHTTLRVPNSDSNRSRWPVHPLWADLQQRVLALECLGVVGEIDFESLLDERETRMAISIYGYLKRFGAIQGIRQRSPRVGFKDSLLALETRLQRLHDELTWENDVRRRYDEMRLGSW